ncbi:uncharacterized protein LOC135090560 isoform X1 [Scylla paramamosain]|uniref:uncharacterized protein LOC135090560 isoform X1 n=1 Tax=Scylla paramamosain TaxID=85552 RepID=UPI003082B1E3
MIVRGQGAREREADLGRASTRFAPTPSTSLGADALTSSDDIFSSEAVMIGECDGESHNTAATLHYCRRRILRPRDIISSILGYRQWNKDGANNQTACMQTFNFLYFLLFFLCLGFGPVLQYNICLKRDQGIGNQYTSNQNTSTNGHEEIQWCSGSLVFVYIVPSLLFIFAYLVTCVVLRFGETEHLQTLLERVYLLASCSPWELTKQRRIWCTFVVWLVAGLVCLVWSLASMLLHVAAASHIPYSFIIPRTKSDKVGLWVGALGILWLQDIVVVMSVLLYCTQCHLLSQLLQLTRTAIYQGDSSLIIIKKQVEETSRFLRHLNQELGLSVGLFLCLLGFRVTTGAISLFYYLKLYIHPEKMVWKWAGQESQQTFHLLALVFNLLPWLVLTVLPLCTAARVSSNYRALNKAGSQLHGRPFGYQSTPQQDLDSFLLYVTSLHLHAKILWIPVRTYFLVSVFVIFVMSFIILSYLYF